ncbi:hypothetical protein MASR1M36_09150 [Candidatus Cloacimonadaceae bacterium]
MKTASCILLCLFFGILNATAISYERAASYASQQLNVLYPDHAQDSYDVLTDNSQAIAYVFHLLPTGYLVVSAQDELPPLLAYSGSSEFGSLEGDNILRDIIVADLQSRQQSEIAADLNRQAWQSITNPRTFQQWPPAGYSTTEGWIKTNWTQNAPYNWMCPMDPISGTRSYAGCPTVAMSQIVNYHRSLNGTRLDDSDDYLHNYGGRYYWIDNDYAAHGFPSFPQLNGYLDQVNDRFRYGQELSDSLKAALIFACGTAMKQVYSSEGSGTFGVNQALQGFERFNFPNVELLTENSPGLYTRISNNIKNAQPVHLAVVTPAWDMGHNVVIDGYNTNEYYHLNFGWGGQYNGWYLLPSQIPYGLTVVEGAIVDIAPYQYVFTVPDTLVCIANVPSSLEINNLHDEAIVLEDVLFDTGSGGYDWTICTQSPLPATIPAGGLFTLSLTQNYGGGKNHFSETSLTLILDDGYASVPVKYELPIPVSDDVLPLQALKLTNYPNPFNPETTISFTLPESGLTSLKIYNCKGQMVKELFKADPGAGTHKCVWNGTDNSEIPVASGLYYCVLEKGSSRTAKKLLLMK